MDVLMPQLGETVAEGKITKWFKSAGDAVKPGDNLFEIETDKTSMEVPATSAGVLTAINVQVGEVAKVGAVVAVISGAGGAASATPAASASAPVPKAPPKAAAAPALADRADTPSSHPARWTHSLRCGRRSGISAPPSSRAGRSSRRWRGGLPASAASICRASTAPGRMAVLLPPTSKRRSQAAPGVHPPLQWRLAPRRPRSRRSTRASTTRKCRSTACARPSPRASPKRSRPSRISI